MANHLPPPLPPGAPRADAAEVHVRLLRLFASPTYRPPVLPAVALEILRLSQQPAVTFAEVVAVLERDPLLAAKVLALSQSASYASRSPILSLHQATVRLGMKTVRDLVLEAALKLRVFKAPGYEQAMERLSRHSTATAYLAAAVGRRAAVAGDGTFLCGLLHDVGIAASLLALADDTRGRVIPYQALGSVLRDTHESASGLVTRLWGLPEEIQRAAASHHQLVVGGTPHPVNAVLIVAEALAGELDAGLAPLGSTADDPGAFDAPAPELVAEAQAALRLDARALEEARAEAAGVLRAGGLSTPAPGAPPSPRA